jgi:L-ribulokinase
VSTGEVVATAVHAYKDAVIDRTLPRSGMPLPPDWVLQNPAGWLEGLQETLHQVLQKSGISGEEVIGLGIDFTTCTVLPTAAGEREGGYADLTEAARHMAPSVAKIFTPRAESVFIYRRPYAEYRRLVDYFGGGENLLMETLGEIKRDAVKA